MVTEALAPKSLISWVNVGLRWFGHVWKWATPQEWYFYRGPIFPKPNISLYHTISSNHGDTPWVRAWVWIHDFLLQASEQKVTGGCCLEETPEMGSIHYPNIAIFNGDNDDHRISGYHHPIGTGHSERNLGNYKFIMIKLGNRCRFILVCHIRGQKKVHFLQIYCFPTPKKLKKHLNHSIIISPNIFAEPDAHGSGRCPLQIALQRSLALLSKRKPQLYLVTISTWIFRCENTKTPRTRECACPNRVVP